MRFAINGPTAAAVTGIFKCVPVWVACLSIVLFLLMGIDKRRAKKNRYRIPEKVLFAFALLGGAPGGWAGMVAFRHKTKHWYFRIFFPLLTVLWLAALLCTVLAARG